jgi:hypothetical protein
MRWVSQAKWRLSFMEGRQEGFEPLDRADDLSSLRGEVEAVGRVIAQCNSAPAGCRRQAHMPLTEAVPCAFPPLRALCPRETRPRAPPHPHRLPQEYLGMLLVNGARPFRPENAHPRPLGAGSPVAHTAIPAGSPRLHPLRNTARLRDGSARRRGRRDDDAATAGRLGRRPGHCHAGDPGTLARLGRQPVQPVAAARHTTTPPARADAVGQYRRTMRRPSRALLLARLVSAVRARVMA